MPHNWSFSGNFKTCCYLTFFYRKPFSMKLQYSPYDCRCKLFLVLPIQAIQTLITFFGSFGILVSQQRHSLYSSDIHASVCHITFKNNTISTSFSICFFIIAAVPLLVKLGQTAVFYDDDFIRGGIIQKKIVIN